MKCEWSVIESRCFITCSYLSFVCKMCLISWNLPISQKITLWHPLSLFCQWRSELFSMCLSLTSLSSCRGRLQNWNSLGQSRTAGLFLAAMSMDLEKILRYYKDLSVMGWQLVRHTCQTEVSWAFLFCKEQKDLSFTIFDKQQSGPISSPIIRTRLSGISKPPELYSDYPGSAEHKRFMTLHLGDQ